MNQALINFRDNIPVGVSEEMALKEIIKHIYVQSLKHNKRMYVIGSFGLDYTTVSGFASLFIEKYWNYGRS